MSKQFPPFTEDDLHSIVQMGFVQNSVNFSGNNCHTNYFLTTCCKNSDYQILMFFPPYFPQFKIKPQTWKLSYDNSWFLEILRPWSWMKKKNEKEKKDSAVYNWDFFFLLLQAWIWWIFNQFLQPLQESFFWEVSYYLHNYVILYFQIIEYPLPFSGASLGLQHQKFVIYRM